MFFGIIFWGCEHNRKKNEQAKHSLVKPGLNKNFKQYLDSIIW